MNDTTKSADAGPRWTTCTLGVILMFGVVFLQSPFLTSTLSRGLDYSPGKTGAQTTWATLVIVTDLLLLVLWMIWRPRPGAWAILPAALALVLWVPLVYVAMFLRGLIYILVP